MTMSGLKFSLFSVSILKRKGESASSTVSLAGEICHCHNPGVLQWRDETVALMVPCCLVKRISHKFTGFLPAVKSQRQVKYILITSLYV